MSESVKDLRAELARAKRQLAWLDKNFRAILGYHAAEAERAERLRRAAVSLVNSLRDPVFTDQGKVRVSRAKFDAVRAVCWGMQPFRLSIKSNRGAK